MLTLLGTGECARSRTAMVVQVRVLDGLVPQRPLVGVGEDGGLGELSGDGFNHRMTAAVVSSVGCACSGGPSGSVLLVEVVLLDGGGGGGGAATWCARRLDGRLVNSWKMAK